MPSKFSKLKEAASKKKAAKEEPKPAQAAPKKEAAPAPSEPPPAKPQKAAPASPPKEPAMKAAAPEKMPSAPSTRAPVVRREPEPPPSPPAKKGAKKGKYSPPELPKSIAPEDLPQLPADLPKKPIPPPPIIIAPPPPPPPVYKLDPKTEKLISPAMKNALDEKMRQLNEAAKAQMEQIKQAKKNSK